MQMVRTQYWILERDVGTSFFRLRRTSVAYESLESVAQTAVGIERALVGVDLSRLGFLVDLREGPMRNDPEFEKAARPWQEKLMRVFGRVALLVKTPAGKLQMGRIVRTLGASAQVFDVEAQAIAFLKAGPPIKSG